jgi:hypothetical protein
VFANYRFRRGPDLEPDFFFAVPFRRGEFERAAACSDGAWRIFGFDAL